MLRQNGGGKGKKNYSKVGDKKRISKIFKRTTVIEKKRKKKKEKKNLTNLAIIPQSMENKGGRNGGARAVRTLSAFYGLLVDTSLS